MSASPERAARDPSGPSAPERERRVLSRTELAILGALAVLPLLSIALRVLALPGVDHRGLEGLASIGDSLNQALSLSDIPWVQRNQVIYLLLIPSGAILVSLARLTFGLKVLAFRSILIGVAFHQSGLIPSLLLIAFAIIAVQVLRPWLRHIELPKYARVSVILCLLAVLMLGVTLLGPLLPTDIAWGMAAFPVIALAFLAEGIAQTVDRDHYIRAYWIALNTIGIAMLMAVLFWIPALRSFLLSFPEIILTQSVVVVMIAKYLDLRLFEHWDDNLMSYVRSQAWLGGRHKVAVIRNRVDPDERSPRTLRSVQKIVDALREARYRVMVMEGDQHLPRELRRFFPENPTTGERDGVVLNLAQGSRGESGTTHVPAMLEVFGIAYSGPTPLGHAMMFDRMASKILMRQAGVPTPEFRLVRTDARAPADLAYPAVVVPRHELDSRFAIVSDRRQLRSAVRRLRHRGVQEAFVENYPAGRRVAVALLGNDPIECLPLVEPGPNGEKVCPAPLEEATAERIREMARSAFHACGCRDYGRVDVRVGESGELWVTEVRTLGILAAGGAFVRAATEAGYSLPDLMARIVEVTRARARAERRARSGPLPSADRAASTLVPSHDPVTSR